MKKILSLIMISLLILTAASCATATGKLDKIKSSGKLTVYTDPNFSPFEFKVGAEVKGVDIEIAKAIAAELGAEVIFKEAKFDSILMAIKGGKGDIAISGFTILEERKESVDFSVPYIESVQYLILPEGSEIAVMEDLAGKRVGVAKDYSGQFLMEDEAEDKDGILYGKNTTLTPYDSAMDAALGLKSGKVDAVVMDEHVAKNIVVKNDGLIAVELRYSNGEIAAEEYGVAVPKGNEDLLAIINNVIKKLKDENKITQWVVEFSE